ncbi:MAG: hypothetical protein IKH11_01595 [Bacteroidales bacterium]|nr:hypothetical protein [Bacteroidales bacterium]
MKKTVQIPTYEAPAVFTITVLPPKVLCISNEEYRGVQGHFDDDSD